MRKNICLSAPSLAACWVVAAMVLALRFSNPYTVVLRSFGWIVVSLCAVAVLAAALLAYSVAARVAGGVLAACGMFVGTGLTTVLPGIAAVIVSVAILVASSICFGSTLLAAGRAAGQRATPN